MSKRSSNVYKSFKVISSLNDVSIQECKNQIFSLPIFSQYNLGPDFQDMLSFNDICNFFIWLNPVGLLLVIFCLGFQSWESLHRNMVVLPIVGLPGSKAQLVSLSASASVNNNLDLIISFYAIDQSASILVIFYCFDFNALSWITFAASFPMIWTWLENNSVTNCIKYRSTFTSEL